MSNNRPIPPEEFRAIYSRVPRLSIDLVIERQGKILLVQRALPSYKGQWHLPGGTLLFKESIEHAIRRIAKDEVGLTVEPGQLLGYITYLSEEKERGYGYTIGLAFRCQWVAGEPQVNEEGNAAEIFSKLPRKTIVEQEQFLHTIGYA